MGGWKMNEAEYQKVLREYRRGCSMRYLRSPEFRRDLFSSMAFFGVMALGIIGLQHAGSSAIAVVYSLISAIAVSVFVRNSYDDDKTH
jgi:hypothetical protein